MNLNDIIDSPMQIPIPTVMPAPFHFCNHIVPATNLAMVVIAHNCNCINPEVIFDQTIHQFLIGNFIHDFILSLCQIH